MSDNLPDNLAPLPSTLAALHDVRIGAAPGPDLGLRLLLAEAGIDVTERRSEIGPVPAAEGVGVSFGVAAAEALADGRVDGFWANGMGAELALRKGTGSLVLDVRRGDGPPAAGSFTFPALAVTDRLIEQNPDAVTRAIVRAQQLPRAHPSRATETAEGRLPPMETSMIAELVRRDAPFYATTISEQNASALAEFGRRAELIDAPIAYPDIVSDRFRELWGNPE